MPNLASPVSLPSLRNMLCPASDSGLQASVDAKPLVTRYVPGLCYLSGTYLR